MQRLTLIHDTNGSIGLIRSEMSLLKHKLAKSPESVLERIPTTLENVERAIQNLIKTIDTWYIEDKAKEAGINIK